MSDRHEDPPPAETAIGPLPVAPFGGAGSAAGQSHDTDDRSAADATRLVRWSLLADLPHPGPREAVDALIAGKGWRIERIVSHGHTAPPAPDLTASAAGDPQPAPDWYDQDEDEWVMVLAGAAELHFQGDSEPMRLTAGDAVWIPAHCRHRVSWTDPDRDTVWLAVFLDP